jgi:hypothetical protein
MKKGSRRTWKINQTKYCVLGSCGVEEAWMKDYMINHNSTYLIKWSHLSLCRFHRTCKKLLTLIGQDSCTGRPISVLKGKDFDEFLPFTAGRREPARDYQWLQKVASLIHFLDWSLPDGIVEMILKSKT